MTRSKNDPCMACDEWLLEASERMHNGGIQRGGHTRHRVVFEFKNGHVYYVPFEGVLVP
jgi:hypothetical protein